MVTRVLPLKETAMAEAAILVKAGGLLVYPTDTVYGLGCDPFNDVAVNRLFEAKGRSAKPVPVLCNGLRSARSLGNLSGTALGLARRFWPGALTIVVPAKRKLPFLVDQGSGEVGLRVPALGACVRLISLCGGFLSGTSANVSGSPSCLTAAEAFGALGGRVDIILDGGTLRGGESTVVRVRQKSVEVLRKGPVEVPGA